MHLNKGKAVLPHEKSDHPHFWGRDELIQKSSDGVFAPKAIPS
jgi:hypothetical protein